MSDSDVSEVSDLESDYPTDSSSEDEDSNGEDLIVEATASVDKEHEEIADDVTEYEVPEEEVSGFGERNNNKPGVEKTSAHPMKEGKRLYGPQKKSRNPSIVWKFGGFLKKRDGFLDMDTVYCGLCDFQTKYRNSPGNFKSHLQHHHQTEFAGEESSSTSKQSKIDEIYKPKPGTNKITKKYKKTDPKQKKGRALCVEWVIGSCRPLSIVEDEKLLELLELLDEKFEVPSRFLVRSDILKLFKSKKAKVIEEFRKIHDMSCTTDAGSSYGAKSFVDVNVHYITEDFKMKKKVIAVLPMKEDKNAENYRAEVDKRLDDFGIKEKVFNFTTDNEATMRKAFTDDERNGCFPHMQSNSSKKALKEQPALKKLRKKCSKIARKANKSNKFKSRVEKHQKIGGVKPITLKQEVATRFTATQIMFKSFINDPNEKTDKAVDREKVEANIKAINDAMVDAKFTKKELKRLKITEGDVDMMLKTLEVLDPLEEAITMTGAENYPTASSVLPLLRSFEKRVFKVDDMDPVYIKELKEGISDKLNTYCDKNLNKDLLRKATFFDKRYNYRLYLSHTDTALECDSVKADIEAELRDLEINEKEETPADEEIEPVRKKARFLGKGIQEDDDEEEAPGVCDADKEMTSYMAEKKIKSSACVLDWWRVNSGRFPLMSRLARKYLSVTAAATAAERVMSKLGLVLTKKRLSMSGDLFDKMMFLSDCT